MRSPGWRPILLRCFGLSGALRDIVRGAPRAAESSPREEMEGGAGGGKLLLWSITIGVPGSLAPGRRRPGRFRRNRRRLVRNGRRRRAPEDRPCVSEKTSLFRSGSSSSGAPAKPDPRVTLKERRPCAPGDRHQAHGLRHQGLVSCGGCCRGRRPPRVRVVESTGAPASMALSRRPQVSPRSHGPRAPAEVPAFSEEAFPRPGARSWTPPAAAFCPRGEGETPGARHRVLR